jgi:hypothetical protein
MQRRRVLVGLAAGGMSLIAGCNSGGGGNNSSNGSGGGNTSADTKTSQSASGAGTSLTPNGSETATAATTALATTTAETARETATQTQTQTQTAAPASIQPETPMTTQIAVSMTSSTSSSSSSSFTSTAMGTAGSGMTTGSMDIDLSDRETYTNDTYSYTIEYPTGWSTTDTDPTSVTFSSSGAPANLQVSITEDIPSSTTLQSATSEFLSGYKQSAEQDGGSVEIQNRKQVTLSNGNPAVLLAAQIGVNEVTLRQKLLFTITDSNIYAAVVTIPEPAYTSSVDQQSTEMLTSLTISSSS